MEGAQAIVFKTINLLFLLLCLVWHGMILLQHNSSLAQSSKVIVTVSLILLQLITWGT